MDDGEWLDRQINGPERVVARWNAVQAFLKLEDDGTELQLSFWLDKPADTATRWAKLGRFNSWFALDMVAMESNGPLALVDGERIFFDDQIFNGANFLESSERRAIVQEANDILETIYKRWAASSLAPLEPADNKCCKLKQGIYECDPKTGSECVLLSNGGCQVPPSQYCRLEDEPIGP